MTGLIGAIVWTFYVFVATLVAAVAVWVWSLWPARPRYRRSNPILADYVVNVRFGVGSAADMLRDLDEWVGDATAAEIAEARAELERGAR